VTECIRDEIGNAPDDGDPASCVCGDYDDRHTETALSIDAPRRALASSYEATGS
jgi:hypothetical protein